LIEDPFKELIILPKSLNELEHNTKIKMKLGLVVSRSMAGILGPYEKLYITNETSKEGRMFNKVEFYIYTNLSTVENRYRSSK
jgi:hypothetical protein